jgi:hypothetical protein
MQLAYKEQEISRISSERQSAGLRHGKGSSSWLGGLASALAPQSAEAERLKMLQMSIEGLSIMESTLASDVADMLAEQERDRVCTCLS